MMSRQRSSEAFDYADRVGTFVLANLFWTLLAIPIVTIPAATAGLFATMMRWARGESAEVFRDFFTGMRQHWRKASMIGVLDALIGTLIFLNIVAFRLMDMSNPIAIVSRSMTAFFAAFAIMVNLYLWPLLVTFDMPLRRLLNTAVRLVFARPLWSFGMLALALIPIIVSLFLPSAVFVLVTASTVALLTSKAAWRVISQLNGAEIEQ
jgi:uncharacterized membrane protein YesL